MASLNDLEALISSPAGTGASAAAAAAAAAAGAGAGAAAAAASSARLGPRSQKSDAEKPHVCTYDGCTYRGAEAHHLVRHIRTHTGERPYACSTCAYTAAEAGTLARHMRTHGLAPQLSCQHIGCSFTASSKVQLGKHARGAHPL